MLFDGHRQPVLCLMMLPPGGDVACDSLF
uniref:Uncharacterized protein n=1 Tax=Anguilla anguilla TaxID=7936 RepID=A0A0E9PDM0_ANGAN